MRFRDRREAGTLLAEELTFLKGREDVIVLAIPRGGVVVGYEVAKSLEVPLSVYITRKIGAPSNPELAIGALASDGSVVLDEGIIRQLAVSSEYVGEEKARQQREIERRLAKYSGGRPLPELEGKVVVLVDDGVATGATMLATIRALQRRELAQLILAIPVGPPDTVEQLSREVDMTICLSAPPFFWAVGEFYDIFDQTSDEEVTSLLAKPTQ